MGRMRSATAGLVVVAGLSSCATSGPVATRGKATPTPRSLRPSNPGFELALASDLNGQRTPLEAATWFGLHGRVAGVPRSGWHQISISGHEAELASGSSTLHAIQGPDNTWQIDSGQPCN